MSKEYLEALETLKDMLIGNGCNNSINDYVDNLILPINQALQRLESIDNANPSEALEGLKKNEELFDEIAKENPTTYKDGTVIEAYLFMINTIKIEQALQKAREQEKVLEIILEKNVNLEVLSISNDVNIYNKVITRYSVWYKELTKEEFELLKKTLV